MHTCKCVPWRMSVVPLSAGLSFPTGGPFWYLLCYPATVPWEDWRVCLLCILSPQHDRTEEMPQQTERKKEGSQRKRLMWLPQNDGISDPNPVLTHHLDSTELKSVLKLGVQKLTSGFCQTLALPCLSC